MTLNRTPTAELAQFCASLRGKQLPDAVQERVRYLLLDFLGVTLGGSTLPSSLATYRFLSAMGADSYSSGRTIIGRREKAEASWAALANGVAAHGLEMDDVENGSSLHPGVVVFPAALALAELLNSTVDDFYAAVVAGYEIALRVGTALNPASTYERGFHPTAICGALAATAVSARLLNLSARECEMALGIAGSMAAGSQAYLHDGAWTKRLHPGWASHAGISAARMAAVGFRGPTSILEGPHGILKAYSSGSLASKLALTDEFAIMGVSIKPYGCCRYMHGPIDCLLAIKNEHQPDPARIENIHCGVLKGGWSLIVHPIEQKRSPQNIVESQFSMPFGAALALLTGQAGPAFFSEEWINHPEIRTLMEKVTCYASPDLDNYYPAEWRASAVVTMTDGARYYTSVRYPLGDPHNPLSWSQLEDRFHSLAAQAGYKKDESDVIVERVRTFEGVRGIMSALSGHYDTPEAR